MSLWNFTIVKLLNMLNVIIMYIIVKIFKEVTGKNVLLLPMGSGDDGAHSQNEKIEVRNYVEGVSFFIYYFYCCTYSIVCPIFSFHFFFFYQLIKWLSKTKINIILYSYIFIFLWRKYSTKNCV